MEPGGCSLSVFFFLPQWGEVCLVFSRDDAFWEYGLSCTKGFEDIWNGQTIWKCRLSSVNGVDDAWMV